MKNFGDLIKAISSALGPTSGLDSEDVDHDQLIILMEEYRSDETEWLPYSLFDSNRNYTRNLVDDTNGKSNILVVCWVRM
jgi:cysteine dioxygenase